MLLNLPAGNACILSKILSTKIFVNFAILSVLSTDAISPFVVEMAALAKPLTVSIGAAGLAAGRSVPKQSKSGDDKSCVTG